MSLPLIPTTIIGSMPKPRWLTTEWFSIGGNWAMAGTPIGKTSANITSSNLSASVEVNLSLKDKVVLLLAGADVNLIAVQAPPLAGNKPLVDAIQAHGEAVFGEKPPAVGTPLYTDVRLYGEHGIPAAIYGAGPRTVLESHAKRADERVDLADLRRATQVVARTLLDLLRKS